MIKKRDLILKVHNHREKENKNNYKINLMEKYNFLENLLKYFNKNKINNDYNY